MPGKLGFRMPRGGAMWGCSGGGLAGVWERALWSRAAGWRPPSPPLTEEGRQVGHRLEEGPRLDLLVRRERLQQVLGQQRHFGVETCSDAPTGAAGVHAAPPAAAVSARAVTAARRRLTGRQRRHFRSRCARLAER